jgi:hypothetical protein
MGVDAINLCHEGELEDLTFQTERTLVKESLEIGDREIASLPHASSPYSK